LELGSYILQATYRDVDLDEDPVIVLSCRHLMALSSMDGHPGMSDYYELSPSFSAEALKPLPEPFSTENVKKCPMCRGSLRDINRCNRIVAKSCEGVTEIFSLLEKLKLELPCLSNGQDPGCMDSQGT